MCYCFTSFVIPQVLKFPATYTEEHADVILRHLHFVVALVCETVLYMHVSCHHSYIRDISTEYFGNNCNEIPIKETSCTLFLIKFRDKKLKIKMFRKIPIYQ
jgi:hypothetical protein